MSAVEVQGQAVERVELARLAGKMVKAVEYLQKQRDLRMAEGVDAPRLWEVCIDLRDVRERIVELSRVLPQGPLEAFARAHPLYDDPIDGLFCGYGAKDGKPYTCPVRDPALHWDAWELMGTRHKRPARAARPAGQREG